jgi:hypothetical protein
MPARVLPPPAGMSEKEYAWMLFTNRCMKCHLVKPLEIDWNHQARCCVECLGSTHQASAGLIETIAQYQDTRARKLEMERELLLIEKEYLERVKGLGGQRGCEGWKSAVLAKIPRYAKIISGRNITPTDNSFKIKKSSDFDNDVRDKLFLLG